MWHGVLRPCIPNGRWAISRQIAGRWITLVERAPVYNEADITFVLEAFGILGTEAMRDRFCPHSYGAKCCPTLELRRLFAAYYQRYVAPHRR